MIYIFKLIHKYIYITVLQKKLVMLYFFPSSTSDMSDYF